MVDDPISAANLYVRAQNGDVHVIIDPGGAAIHAGAINNLGLPVYNAMTYDAPGKALYIFETQTSASGRIVMLK